jgi:hypothetical protein
MLQGKGQDEAGIDSQDSTGPSIVLGKSGRPAKNAASQAYNPKNSRWQTTPYTKKNTRDMVFLPNV